MRSLAPLLVVCAGALGFTPARVLQRRDVRVRATNPNDLETDAERRERMDMVRKVQRAFYVDEPGLQEMEPGGILRDLPLWRVPWAALPGTEHVHTISDPHYTVRAHRFEK